MNVLDFRNLVLAMVKTEGVQFPDETSVADLHDLIGRQLDTYCRKTGCLELGETVFTPQVGVAAYDLQDANADGFAFARRLASVRHVMIEGVPLFAIGTDKAGISSEELAVAQLPGYLVADPGRPSHFWPEGETRIRFNRPFDQVYTGCFVLGPSLPAALDRDNQELELSPTHIQAAARYCAGELLMPYSREAGAAILSYARSEASDAASELTKRQGGRSVRGSRRGSVSRL